MNGKKEFSAEEAEKLRALLREKEGADRTRQKSLRQRMRALCFYISDFSVDNSGFTVRDFDELVRRGAITVIC